MKCFKFLSLVLFFSSTVVFAANPSQPFLPSDNVQDPNCTPLDSNCYVLLTSFTNETVTGLDYATSSGVLSLTSGYIIPTIASTTAWDAAVGGVSTSTLLQDGNSFGTSTVIGSNDANALIFKTSGLTAGYISADGSNVFFGRDAGLDATYAYNSNFLGYSAGQNANNAYNSNFLGYSAGQYASQAYNSNFVGNSAGNGASSANNSNFLGYSAGNYAYDAANSNFLGYSAGNGANNAYYSNFLGYSAGQNANNAYNSNFLGYSAGQYASQAYNSNFVGNSAGNGASSANNSNFLGYSAGNYAYDAANSNFLGYSAGQNASFANNSNFLGAFAGNAATNAANSNFLGTSAGRDATSAYASNFIGLLSGEGATNAYNSNFIGNNAGNYATNANNSIFIGRSSGESDTVDNTSNSKYSILIGDYTNTGGFSNSISIGQGVSNSATDQLNIGRIIYAKNIGSSTSPTSSAFAPALVGIGTSTPLDKLQVFGDIRVGTTGSNGCIKNYAGTGLTGTCSSDERLKGNIVDFSEGYLDKLINLRVISYNWNDTAKDLNKVDTSVTNYGLLAQNVEQNFPELVSTDSNGYKQVDYSRLPLYLLKSIQELSKKVAGFADYISTKEIKTNKLCVEDICVTKEQFRTMLQNTNVTPTISQPPTPVVVTPDPVVDVVPVPDTTSTSTVIETPTELPTVQ